MVSRRPPFDKHEALVALLSRIELIKNQFGPSQKRFAHKIGISDARLSLIFSKKRMFSVEFLLRIIHYYPMIDAQWLLTGVPFPKKRKRRVNDDQEDD